MPRALVPPVPVPRPSSALVIAGVAGALLAVTGCATVSAPDPGAAAPASDPAASPEPVGPSRAGSVPSFAPCGRAPADASRTHLLPSALDASDRARAGSWDDAIPDGRLVVEAAAELDVRDGVLGAGNGYEASVGLPLRTVPVTGTTVPAAPVSLAVLDSPSSGRRVAFVEIRLDPAPPARWVAEPDLGIVTDGGDGGFLAPGASPSELDDAAASAAVDASFGVFFPDGDDVSTWNQCVVRSTEDRVDGVLFSTGWGDGVYPTYLGLDAEGDVVSVVSFGGVLPWNLSGLPGEPPPADEVGP